MNKDEILKYMREYAGNNGYKFIEEKGGFAGSKSGYPFVAICSKNCVTVIITAVNLKGEREKLKEFYSDMAQNNITVDSLYQGPNVLSLILYPNKLGDEFIEKGLDIAVASLEKLKAEKPTKCCICAKEKCDTLGDYAGGYRPMHRKCIENMVEDAQKTEKAMLNSGSYIKGFPGAVLGMLAGLALAGVSMIAFDNLAAILLALVPMFINYSYRRTGGKPNMKSLWITGAFSLVSIAVMQIMIGLKGYLAGRTFSLTAALPDILISTIFVAMGMINVYTGLRKIPGTAKKQGEAILSTLSEIK